MMQTCSAQPWPADAKSVIVESSGSTAPGRWWTGRVRLKTDVPSRCTRREQIINWRFERLNGRNVPTLGRSERNEFPQASVAGSAGPDLFEPVSVPQIRSPPLVPD